MAILDQITDGRTDLVFDYLAHGNAATATDKDGVSLIKWCAYFGDVSAIRFLLANGESLASVAGELTTAAFHGHWQLCQFLIENGANVNQAEDETGETPLHAGLCKFSASHDRVVRVLLANGADPNSKTKAGAETGGFMRADQGRNSSAPRGRLRQRRNRSASTRRRRAERGSRLQWRYSTFLGKLASAAGLYSQKIMLRSSSHQRRPKIDGR